MDPEDNELDENLDAGGEETGDGGNNEDAGNEPESSLAALEQALDGDDDNDKEERDDDEQEKETDGQEKEEDEGKEGDSEPLSDEDLIAPLPEDVKAETRERFEKLAASYKEIKQESETIAQENTLLKQDVDDFRGLLEYSGATPEEFNQLVEYSHLVKSGDLEGALKLLDEQRNSIAMMLGKPVAGIDLLADHADLREQVDQGLMPEEAAVELAAARNKQRMTEQATLEQQRRMQAEQQTLAQQEAAREQAIQAIQAMDAQWSRNDIDYAAKQQQLVEKAREIAAKYKDTPQLWPEALQLYYDSLSVAQQTTETTTTGKKNEHRPLRPAGGAGGEQAPKSSLEALERTLGAR